jgi:hypothetical protein
MLFHTPRVYALLFSALHHAEAKCSPIASVITKGQKHKSGGVFPTKTIDNDYRLLGV